MNKLNKKQQQKNEAFYIKKRSLVRKAQQIIKHCESDVLIVIHKHDTDRMFSFSSSDQFDLAKVAKLVRKDVSERVQVRKAEKFVTQDFSKVDKRIRDIQTLLDNQDYVSTTSTENDTKEKTPAFTDFKKINVNIRMREETEGSTSLDQQSPCKSEKITSDVIRSSQSDEIGCSEFEDQTSSHGQHPQSQLIYSSSKSMAQNKPFIHKTPSPENLVPLKMNFNLSKVNETAGSNPNFSPCFQSLTPRQYQSHNLNTKFGAFVPRGEVRPLASGPCAKIHEAQNEEDLEVCTPKSNVQFKNANSPNKVMQTSNWLPQRATVQQLQLREVDQKMQSDVPLHFQHPNQPEVHHNEHYQVQNTNTNLFSVNQSYYYEPTLNCDDIVWFNNWDDVRQE